MWLGLHETVTHHQTRSEAIVYKLQKLTVLYGHSVMMYHSVFRTFCMTYNREL